jgi:hypothetical protein
VIAIEKLRIFSFNGIEIGENDELSMIENNSYLFVSLGRFIFRFLFYIGEPYDGRACLGAFHKIRILGEVNISQSKLISGWFRKSLSRFQ